MYTDPSGHLPCDEDGYCYDRDRVYKPKYKTTLPWTSPFYHKYPVKSVFNNDGTSKDYHPGIDYGIPVGTVLYASGYGTVVVVDRCSLDNNCVYEGDRSDAPANAGYGNVVVIEYPYDSIPADLRNELKLKTDQSLYVVYAHLEKIFVAQGERVSPGQVIGTTGDTGNSTGPHLHLAVKKGDTSYMTPGQMCGVISCYPPGTSKQKPDDYARYGLLRLMDNVDPTILDDYYTVDLINH
jgi:murein DD-endopeptidase MepM/ murein hydrolase activator NlpD